MSVTINVSLLSDKHYQWNCFNSLLLRSVIFLSKGSTKVTKSKRKSEELLDIQVRHTYTTFLHGRDRLWLL